VILSNGKTIVVKDLPQEIREPAPSIGPQDYRESPVFDERAILADTTSLRELSPSDRLPQWGLRPRQLRTIDFIKNHGFITNRYYSQLNDISERQALRELTEMVASGVLQRIGKGRACRYVMETEKPQY
jgi:two-component system NtrC family response regulator